MTLRSTSPITDSFGRTISYLRLSITDRCNLSCTYCRGTTPTPLLAGDHMLTVPEISRVVGILYDLGVHKVRLTGGEPLARREFPQILQELRRNFPSLDIRITSNGTLLAQYVPLIAGLGISAVNLSIDSFRRETFARITGTDLLPSVLSALHALMEARVCVKINAVAMRSFNDSEMPLFLEILKRYPLDLRFIEFMPMGSGTVWSQRVFWSADDILAEAGRFARLSPVTSGCRSSDAGPARMFTLEGYQGRIGIISPVTNHFCAFCNRLRLTSDGSLRTCLYADSAFSLRTLLRSPGTTDRDIEEAIREAVRTKPVGAAILEERTSNAVSLEKMSCIGG